jgi:outer membrane lipase/esterase
VNGCTESGDPVLTLTVGQQTAETLVGSVGGQLRVTFMVNGRIISPNLNNLTAEDDLIGNGRIIQFGATSAPLIINNWAIPNGTSQHLYGRVAGAVVAPVNDNLALTMSLSQTVVARGPAGASALDRAGSPVHWFRSGKSFAGLRPGSERRKAWMSAASLSDSTAAE